MIRKNRKKIQVFPENLVSISNSLALSKYSIPLTLKQTQLLFYMIKHEQREVSYELHKCDFEKSTNISSYNTEQIKKDIFTLRDLKFNVTEDINGWRGVFKAVEYRQGIVRFEFSQEFMVHIKNLRDRYIILDFACMSKFTSVKSWILYGILKANYGRYNISYSKKELIEMLDIKQHAGYFKNNAMFEKRVLNVIGSDINRHSELVLYFEEIKHFRGDIIIRFDWTTGEFEKLLSFKQKEELLFLIQIFYNDLSRGLAEKVGFKQEMMDVFNEIQQIQAAIESGLNIKKYKDTQKIIQKAIRDFKKFSV